MGVYEDLREVENLLEREGYDIDWFEIGKKADTAADLKDSTAPRAVGRNPVKALEKWQKVSSEDDGVEDEEYFIEVFFSNSLDIAIYDSEVGKLEYIKFSSADNSVKELLEE
ncbi:MAG: hypothetical protein ACI8Z7_000283 [Candidatus Nanohaloarchaea archaeon]|jgi:hypothetical protein